MITLLAITGWLTAAFFALSFYGARKSKLGWRQLFQETEDARLKLERQQIAACMDKESLKWYREENTRLHRKCDAICSQIRRMKGRGAITCQINPQHYF